MFESFEKNLAYSIIYFQTDPKIHLKKFISIQDLHKLHLCKEIQSFHMELRTNVGNSSHRMKQLIG